MSILELSVTKVLGWIARPTHVAIYKCQTTIMTLQRDNNRRTKYIIWQTDNYVLKIS